MRLLVEQPARAGLKEADRSANPGDVSTGATEHREGVKSFERAKLSRDDETAEPSRTTRNEPREPSVSGAFDRSIPLV